MEAKFYYRSYGKTDDKGFVWVSFYIKREKVHFSTKVEVYKKHWDAKKKIVTSADEFASDKNLIISNIAARINDVIVKYRLRNKTITKQMFLRAYNRPSDFDTFFDFVDNYQKKLSARNGMSTFLSEKVVMKKLKAYAPDLTFDEITRDFIDEYFVTLLKEHGNNKNTANKNMAIFRKYVRAAYKSGYMDEYPFEDWSIQKTTSSIVYLDPEELSLLMDYYNSGYFDYNYHQALEVFLFLCFSSLHIGDARELLIEQFNADSFTYYRKKLINTYPRPVLVPISEPLKKILHNIVGTRKKGKVFENLPADQVLNRRVKELIKEIGIEKNISLKVGRHTFATIFLKKTKDLATLKEIMGHSEVKETLIYAHVMADSKYEGIDTAFSDFGK